MLKCWWLAYGFVLLFGYGMYGQSSQVFEPVSKEELLLSRYEKDTIAEALVIYDMATLSFAPAGSSFRRIIERSTRIKIFNNQGFKWSEVTIPCYQNPSHFERLTDIEGTTYNLENGILQHTHLDKRNIYEEKLENGWFLKKFAMPDVREGSVIEIKYTLESSFIFNLPSWEFQQRIPVLYSSYKARMIPYYTYVHLLQGAERCDQYLEYESRDGENQYGTETYTEKIQEYVMKNLPAFRDETYISSYNDYVVKLDFQLAKIRTLAFGTEAIITTWPELVQNMLENNNFGGYLKAARPFTKELVKPWLSSTEKEKAVAIDKYLKQNYNWNGYVAKLSDKTAKDFIKTKIGNAASLNLLYVSMLKESGISAYPVLISTRGNGKIHKEYPFAHLFNYVLVMAEIEGKSIALDATDPICQFGELPARCLNDQGLVVKKEKKHSTWWDFSPNDTSTLAYHMELFLDKEADSVIANFTVKASGYDALSWRKNGIDNTKEGLAKNLPVGHMTFNEFAIEKPRKTTDGYEVKFKATEAVSWIGGKLILHPFCQLVLTENPFKASERRYPVDLVYKRYKSYVALIHIPKYLQVENLPNDSLAIDNEQFKIKYRIVQVDAYTLRAEGSYLLKKDMYPAQTYAILKEAFDLIIERFNQNLILVRKY